MSETNHIIFEVADWGTQTILISVQGKGVLLFEDNALGQEVDDELIIPNVVLLFVQLVNLGMLSGSTYAPWTSQAEITVTEVDLTNQQQTWHVKLQNIEKNTFRVLLNLFLAQQLNKIAIKTLEIPPEAKNPNRIALEQLTLPFYFQPLPFQLEIEEPMRSSKNRIVQIVFAQELEPSLVKTIYQALEAWTNAIIWGAYPRFREEPKQAGALPDGVYQLDAFTVEQGFSEMFAADESAFFAVINYAHQLHHTQLPVQSVCIE
jgi:hypothetical protein